MGEAILYNRHTIHDIKYDWDKAFNNPDFIDALFIALIDYYDYTMTSIPDYEFKNVNSYKTVHFYMCYKGIGTEAFANMKNLFMAEFGMSSNNFSECYDLEEYAFANCSNLQTVNTNTYLNIKSGAFENCKNLLYIRIGIPTAMSSLLYMSKHPIIYSHAFDGCINLQNLQLQYVDEIKPYTFESFGFSTIAGMIGYQYCEKIGSHAFKDCKSLSGMYLINTMGSYINSEYNNYMYNTKYIEIGEYAFEGCDSLNAFSTDVLHKIGSYAFANLSSLFQINLGRKYSSLYARHTPGSIIINEYAFYNCSRLSSIINGSIIDYIGSHAFEKCDIRSLGSGLAYNFIRKISDYAFADCSNLSYININIMGGNSGNQSADGFLGLEIASTAFEGCINLERIQLTFGTDIYPGMFSGYSKLNYVNWEYDRPPFQSLSYSIADNFRIDIGSYAFANCELLSWAQFNYIKSIGSHAFDGCISLSGGFGQGDNNLCDYIDELAFYSCPIYTVWLNTSYYETGAFLYHLSESNVFRKTTFHSLAFKGCSSLSQVVIYNCGDIPEQAFFGISTLTSFIASEWFSGSNTYGKQYMINIGESAFGGTGFSRSPIIRYVKSIGNFAFMGCYSMSYGNQIGTNLCECIGEDAFAGCGNLNYIYFNSQAGNISSTSDILLTIKSRSFQGCGSLSEAHFFNVSKIEQSIFGGDMNLSSIYIIQNTTSNIPELESINAFENMGLPSDYIIYVNSSLYNKYTSDIVWGLISSHIQSY